MKNTYARPYGAQFDYLTRHLSPADVAELQGALDSRRTSKRHGLMKHNPPTMGRPGSVAWRALALAMCPARVGLGFLMMANEAERNTFDRLSTWVELNARWIVQNLQGFCEFNLMKSEV